MARSRGLGDVYKRQLQLRIQTIQVLRIFTFQHPF
jgi:hypothetical protein